MKKFKILGWWGLFLPLISGCAIDESTRSEGQLRHRASAQVAGAGGATSQKNYHYGADCPSGGAPDEILEGALWSDPETWPSGEVPVAGEMVTIPDGSTVVLDVDTAELGGLMIQGELVFSERDLELTADWISVMGTLAIGSPEQPFESRATITLTGDDPDTERHGGTRGLMVMGTLELHSSLPSPTWTRLSDHAPAQSTALSLTESVNWNPGDEIVVAPTDFFEVGGRTERIALSASSGSNLTLAEPLQHSHWGRLQYVQANETQAVTLTPTTGVTDKVIDERAEVGNLTRNIVIQGIDDALWQDEGFGAHVMVMYPGEAHIDGVEFRRVGQAGHLARYPFHWHLWSYDRDGQERGDVEGQYIRNSSIHDSSQRCIVIHGTNGATVENNICFDITGHGIFLEDAVERRNLLQDNLVLTVREVSLENMLLRHERHGFRAGPSGFWITHPDNVVRGNVVADSERLGFWYALPPMTLGLNPLVDTDPSIEPFGVFEDNVSHSTLAEGLLFDHVPIDAEGRTSDYRYVPRVDGNPQNPRQPFSMNRVTIYKVGTAQFGPVWDRVESGTFADFVIADFGNRAFAGSSRCVIENNLIVGRTLNDENGDQIANPAVGSASYHSLCRIPDNIFVNLPAVPGRVSGAFATDDYYITGVDLGLINNARSTFINTHPGYRSPSPNTLQSGSGLQHFSFSGALFDPHGYWGEPESYWVYDMPFFTEGGGCSSVNQPVHGNDVSCAGPYFGLAPIRTTDNQIADEERAVRLTRQSAQGADLSEFFIDDGTCTEVTSRMHNAALVQGATYRVEFPANEQPSDRPLANCTPAGAHDPTEHFVLRVSNMRQSDEWVMLGVPLDGNEPPATAYLTMWPNYQEVIGWPSFTCYQQMQAGASSCDDGGSWEQALRGQFFRPYLPVASRQAVLEDPECDAYYHDVSDDRVWVRVCRGDLPLVEGDPDTNQQVLYQTLSLYVGP